ncbi:hypothetical protein [Pedobacter frigoris]|uniref:MipA/OmpV family protein n=1 Tax=Pedobacter frigoris TaxID=2571272 RepID=A0A4U1CH26_9SPHI|nr:hypothetical protein [Pedobacter frigoris]TKC06054.1 hypothetical protein FA047_12025 [Pedobacter frigoris]
MRLFAFCIFFLSALTLSAQTDSIKKINVTVAAMYSSNASYYGQTTAEKLPYVLANATVRFPVGLYLSAGSYKLLNIGSGLSETDLGIGFEHDFSERLSADIGYTKSFFPANSPLLQAANDNNLDLSVSWQWPWFKSKLEMNYAFGSENDVFLGFENSRSIELGRLFNEKDALSIEPTIEIVAGTQHFFNTYQQQKVKNNNGNGKGNSNGNGNVVTITEAATSFNLLSYNFKLPLYYSRANYMAELSYQFSVLGAGTITEAKRSQSFVGLGFYYQF